MNLGTALVVGAAKLDEAAALPPKLLAKLSVGCDADPNVPNVKPEADIELELLVPTALDEAGAVPDFALSHDLHSVAASSFITMQASHSHCPGCLVASAANALSTAEGGAVFWGLDAAVVVKETEEGKVVDEAEAGAVIALNVFEEDEEKLKGALVCVAEILAGVVIAPFAESFEKMLADAEAEVVDEEGPSDAQLEAADVLPDVEDAVPMESMAGAANNDGVDDVVDVGREPNENVGAAALVEKLNVGAENDQALAGSALGGSLL